MIDDSVSSHPYNTSCWPSPVQLRPTEGSALSTTRSSEWLYMPVSCHQDSKVEHALSVTFLLKSSILYSWSTVDTVYHWVKCLLYRLKDFIALISKICPTSSTAGATEYKTNNSTKKKLRKLGETNFCITEPDQIPHFCETLKHSC